MPKTLGLDLGIASIGWCLYEDDIVNISSDENGEVNYSLAPKRIIDLGSFVFNQLEDGKTGKTENIIRRQKRLMRRQRRRKSFRKKLTRNLFKQYFKVDFLNNVIATKAVKENPFEIKAKGLSQKLTPNELMVALYHYMKWRGFKSNRKSIDGAGKGGDSDMKLMLKGIKTLKENLAKEEGNGSMAFVTPYLLSQYIKNPDRPDLNQHIHNRAKDYSLTVDRATYQKEIEALLDAQIKFGVIDEGFKESYLNIWTYQRSFSDGPKTGPYVLNMDRIIGRCAFDDKPRAPKNSISARKFVLASALVNLRFKIEGDNPYKSLSPEEISSFLESDKIFSVSIKYSTVFNFLKIKNCVAVKSVSLGKSAYISVLKKFKEDNGIGPNEELTPEQQIDFRKEVLKKTFDKDIVAKSDFISKAYKIKNDARLSKGERDFAAKDEFFDELADVLLRKKDDKSIREELLTNHPGFTENLINVILDSDIDSKQVIDLSLDLCRKLIPYLKRGLTYDKAMEAVGYKHTSGDERNEERGVIPPIDEALAKMGITLANPVVKHTLVNLRKILLAIVKVYGHIDDCVVELARELRKSFEERKAIRTSQIDSQFQNNQIRNRLMEDFPHLFRSYSSIKKTDILRYKLYKEQNGISPYTNQSIPYRQIFSNAYQIDHIMPFSQSFDDSISNKVLVETKANADKGNNLPIMFHNCISAFLANNSKISNDKRENLLRTSISDDFLKKDLNDTAYLSKLAKDFITYYMLPPKQKCRSTSGKITELLRKNWGLSGKTHTYYKYDSSNFVSYENKLYQARFFEDFIFDFISCDDKSVTFNFASKTRGEPYEIKIEKKKPKEDGEKKKELSAQDQALNTSIDYYINNLGLFQSHFQYAYRCSFDKLQESISGLRLNGGTGAINVGESLFLENALVLLSAVRIKIQKIIDQKNRDNHLHHALDAAVIGAVNQSIVNRISNANVRGEADKLVFPLPYEGFREEVLSRIYERDPEKLLRILNSLPQYYEHQLSKYDVHVLIPVRQPSHDITGPISNETIMGARDFVDENGNKVGKRLTKTIRIENLKEKDIPNIVDAGGGNKKVVEAISQWFKEKKKTKYPVLSKKGTTIRKVKVYAGSPESVVPLSNQGNRFGGNTICIRVDVYRKPDSPVLYFVPIFYYQVLNKKRGIDNTYLLSWGAGSDRFMYVSEDVLQNNYECIAKLPRYSLIDVVWNGRVSLCYSGGFSSGMFEVYSCLGDCMDTRYFWGNASTSRIQLTCSSISSIKVRSVSVLGKVS